MSHCSCNFTAVKVKTYCEKIIKETSPKSLYINVLFQNDLLQTPIDSCVHIRGPRKNCYTSLRSSNMLAFTKLGNYI
jgi:hypothetical protein